MTYHTLTDQEKENIENRFWAKVKLGELDCWEWSASRNHQGYGLFQMSGRSHHAHRIAWMIEKGEIPERLYVLHHCDNKRCVNPAHLYIGTQADNVRDRDERGRANYTRGIEKPWSKLTEGDVIEIRRLYSIGDFSYLKLSEIYPVCEAQIGRIIRREKWKHI